VAGAKEGGILKMHPSINQLKAQVHDGSEVINYCREKDVVTPCNHISVILLHNQGCDD
jgi:hypothetical protein